MCRRTPSSQPAGLRQWGTCCDNSASVAHGSIWLIRSSVRRASAPWKRSTDCLGGVRMSALGPERKEGPLSDTSSDEYAERLVALQGVWWKRALNVQAPYRWN